MSAREAEMLMQKVKYVMAADWEFERFLKYLREKQRELIAAGEKILEDDFFN